MNIQLNVHFTNGDVLISDRIDTEKAAKDMDVSHDSILAEFSDLYDAWKNIGGMHSFSFKYKGNDIGINTAHVMWIEICGYDETAVEEAQKRMAEFRLDRRMGRGRI